MKKVLWGCFLLLVLAVVVLATERSVFLTPLGKKKIVEKQSDYRVMGFLPTWMVGKTINYCEQLTDMIFLGIEVGEDGGLIWDSGAKRIKGETYTKLKNNFAKCGGKNIVGIKLFDDNKIDIFLVDGEARKRLIRELKELVENSNFGGINVDFEYQGDPLAVLDEKFVGFVRELKEADLGEVSVDVFANTIIKGGSRVEMILDNVDYLVVMAYDFCRPGSTNACPVAPIRTLAGKRNIWEIMEEVVDADLSQKKIIIAFPLYGYEWKTETNVFGSQVKGNWWALASYKRMKEMGEIDSQWDDVSMTPWLAYETEGEIRQIYYEDIESLSRKYSLVSNSHLGGIGFWALGYEGEHEEVWIKLREILGI